MIEIAAPTGLNMIRHEILTCRLRTGHRGRADVDIVVAGSDLSWYAHGHPGYHTSVLRPPATFPLGWRAFDLDCRWNVIQRGPLLGVAEA